MILTAFQKGNVDIYNSHLNVGQRKEIFQISKLLNIARIVSLQLSGIKQAQKNTRPQSSIFEVEPRAFLSLERIPDHHDNPNIGFIGQNFHFDEAKQRQLGRTLNMLALLHIITLRCPLFQEIVLIRYNKLVEEKGNAKEKHVSRQIKIPGLSSASSFNLNLSLGHNLYTNDEVLIYQV